MNRYKKLDGKFYDSKNYKVDLENVATLSTIEDYIQVYKFTDYINLSRLFGLESQLFVKQNDSRDGHRVIDAMLVFREGIKP